MQIPVQTMPISSGFLALGIPWSACNKILNFFCSVPPMGFPFPPTLVQVAMEMSLFLSILDFPILSLIHTKQITDSCLHNSHSIGVFWTRLSRPYPLVHKENSAGKSSTKNFPTPVFILTNHGLLSTVPIPSCHLLPPKYTLNQPKEPLTNACLYIII